MYLETDIIGRRYFSFKVGTYLLQLSCIQIVVRSFLVYIYEVYTNRCSGLESQKCLAESKSGQNQKKISISDSATQKLSKGEIKKSVV